MFIEVHASRADIESTYSPLMSEKLALSLVYVLIGLLALAYWTTVVFYLLKR